MRLGGTDEFARGRMRLGELPEARIASERARLNALGGLVEPVECRRALLLRHFGENPLERCGNCANCLEPTAQVDATGLAQKLRSGVYRNGQRFDIGRAACAGRGSQYV